MVDDKSVQCVTTSPPYYGLRAYSGDQNIEWPTVAYAPMAGLPPLTIAGCDAECEHEWELASSKAKTGGVASAKVQIKGKDNFQIVPPIESGTCQKCGGWRGPLGNEPTLEAYIAHLILCAREWRRVLRDDGVCFVNLGDSYVGGGGYSPNSPSNLNGSVQGKGNRNGARNIRGAIKPSSSVPAKNLLMVPARFALAMQADGWILRSEMVWAKPNPMPESVTDRPTKAHEMIYLFSKRERYFWDTEATRLPPAPGNDGTIRARARTAAGALGGANQHNIEERIYAEIKGANMRSVLTITTPKVTLRDDLDAETRARVIAQLVERGLL
jgi:DNA modification methylase